MYLVTRAARSLGGVCCEPAALLGLLRGLTFVAPFADEVEAALEQGIVGGRGDSCEGEDGGSEGWGRFDGLVLSGGIWVGRAAPW